MTAPTLPALWTVAYACPGCNLPLVRVPVQVADSELTARLVESARRALPLCFTCREAQAVTP